MKTFIKLLALVGIGAIVYWFVRERLAGEPLDLLVNSTLVAQGEVVLVNERYGIRLTQVIAPADRIKSL